MLIRLATACVLCAAAIGGDMPVPVPADFEQSRVVKAIATYQASDSESERRRLHDEVGRIGGRIAADFMLECLAAPGEDVRATTDFLAAIGERRAVAMWVGYLKQGDVEPAVRRVFYRALSRFNDPQARQALAEAVRDEADWLCYYEARIALAAMPGQRGHRPDLQLMRIAFELTPIPPEGLAAHLKNPAVARKQRAATLAARGEIDLQAMPNPDESDFAPPEVIEWAQQSLRKAEDVRFVVEDIIARYGSPGKLVFDHQRVDAFVAALGPMAVTVLEDARARGDAGIRAFAQRCLNQIAEAKASE